MSRIAIIGAGAIGCTLAALLSQAGHDVTLTGRPEQIEAIRQNGLSMDGALGSFTTHPKTAAVLTDAPDFAFLTVKSQDVLPALQANLDALKGGAPLVTFQNGLQSDALAATLLPPGQIISVVVNTGATYLKPGAVTVAYPGTLMVGRPFAGNDVLVEQLAGILNAAIPSQVTANIAGAHWTKLIVNLNNAFPAMTNLSVAQVYANRYLRQLSVRVMREGLRVAKHANVKLESLANVPVNLIMKVARLPLPLASILLARSYKRTDSDWPLLGSTLQSLRRGRPTEIDYLNGEIVQVGQRVSIPTPLNAAIVEIVHQVEKTGQYWPVSAIRARINSR